MLAASHAFAEPGLSPQDAQRQKIFVVCALAFTGLLVLAISSFLIRLIFAKWTVFKKTLATLLLFACFVAVGLATGIIPVIVIVAALIGAGRTM